MKKLISILLTLTLIFTSSAIAVQAATVLVDTIANLEEQLQPYIDSKEFSDALNLCNKFLYADYISEQEKVDIETKIEDLKNKSTEYYTKSIKPFIQSYMNSKLYIETIQTCETALNKLWLPSEEYIYLHTTLNEAQSKYNEYRRNDAISKINSYMDSKLYIETMQLCEQVIGKSFLSTDDNEYLKQKASEARSKYNAYRIKNQKSKAESYMKSKLYVETIQTCDEALSWSFLSSEERQYFQSTKTTAEDKYSEYLASQQSEALYPGTTIPNFGWWSGVTLRGKSKEDDIYLYRYYSNFDESYLTGYIEILKKNDFIYHSLEEIDGEPIMFFVRYSTEDIVGVGVYGDDFIISTSKY